jgi:hypothetical protein
VAGISQLLHLVDQRSALPAKFGGGAFRAADHLTDFFKGVRNQSSFDLPQA